MHVLVFRHVPFEDAGRIAPALETRGFRLEYVDLFRNPQPPTNWRDAAGLVLMGGPMSANDDREFIRVELALLREALAEAMPVLGICLGSQLLARAAGARVYRNHVREIGWAPVHWTEAAAADSLFSGLPSPETIFHWHGETFDLPAGAAHLAWSEVTPNQAFRLGKAAYGLQFHLEVTPAMIADWCCQDANKGDVRQIGSPIDSKAHADRMAVLSDQVFGRWADMIRP